MKKVFAIVAVSAAALWGMMVTAVPAGAAPGYGNGNFIIFYPNLGDPTNGTVYVYTHGSVQSVYRAGSGTWVTGDSTPCNKYWGDGSGDTNGGGRLPGFASNGSPYYYPSPSGWTQGGAPYGNGLTLGANWAWGVIYGFDHDCGTWPYAVPRDGLFVHKTNASGNGSYVTQGCIKINGTDMANFDAIFHFWATWGGSDGVYYASTALAWG